MCQTLAKLALRGTGPQMVRVGAAGSLTDGREVGGGVKRKGERKDGRRMGRERCEEPAQPSPAQPSPAQPSPRNKKEAGRETITKRERESKRGTSDPVNAESSDEKGGRQMA